MSLSLTAQTTKKIEILNADNTIADANKHPDYWRLIGNVSFKHNNAIMHCDSAYHFSNKDRMNAFGKIKITQGDSITITGENLTYFGLKNQAEIKGNVVLIDKYITLKTKQISYNLNSNIALYHSYGEIIDAEKTIKSQQGEYHADMHNFIFKDSVTVVAKDYNILTNKMHYNTNSEITYFFGPSFLIYQNKTIYCENGWHNTKTNISQFQENAYITSESYLLKGDSLYYNRNSGYGKVMKNVELSDTIDNITVFGGFGEYFEEKEIMEITKKPLLQIPNKKDTLFMHADKFISQQKNKQQKIIAYNKVKFFKKNLQGKCDSLSYNFTDSIVEMFKSPILWSGELQITSDSIKFLVNNGNIRHLFLRSNPMIISIEDSLDYNQVKGKEMKAYFIENKIVKMNIEGNGQSIFILADEKTNEKIGLKYTECTNLTLYFEDNKLDLINYAAKPKSITIPYKDVIEKERYLRGFLWRGNEQPKTKEDIFIE